MTNDFYLRCDELDALPAINRENWLFELDLLEKILPKNSNVLQVGCMDGTRIIKLLERRPDLHMTGLDIEKEFLEIAERSFTKTGPQVRLIQADITKPQNDLGHYDFVICLNNTLGYIAEANTAIENMRRLSDTVIVSVYGEKFTDEVAKKYYDEIGLPASERNHVKRFTQEEVTSWSNTITKTPLGYFCVIN